jgi:hypothetical protein
VFRLFPMSFSIGLGFQVASETLPRGEQRGASRASGFAGNRLHEM